MGQLTSDLTCWPYLLLVSKCPDLPCCWLNLAQKEQVGRTKRCKLGLAIQTRQQQPADQHGLPLDGGTSLGMGPWFQFNGKSQSTGACGGVVVGSDPRPWWAPLVFWGLYLFLWYLHVYFPSPPPSLSLGFSTVLVGKLLPVWEGLRARFVSRDRRVAHFKGRPWWLQEDRGEGPRRSGGGEELGSAQDGPTFLFIPIPVHPVPLAAHGPPHPLFSNTSLVEKSLARTVCWQDHLCILRIFRVRDADALGWYQASGKKSSARQAHILNKMESVYSLCLDALWEFSPIARSFSFKNIP